MSYYARRENGGGEHVLPTESHVRRFNCVPLECDGVLCGGFIIINYFLITCFFFPRGEKIRARSLFRALFKNYYERYCGVVQFHTTILILNVIHSRARPATDACFASSYLMPESSYELRFN